MTLIGKATEKGLDEVAQKVLAPHFHGENTTTKKVRHHRLFLWTLLCSPIFVFDSLGRVVLQMGCIACALAKIVRGLCS
jgi:hypothetical protein